jgi:hypothetical protein
MSGRAVLPLALLSSYAMVFGIVISGGNQTTQD